MLSGFVFAKFGFLIDLEKPFFHLTDNFSKRLQGRQK
jgi:hypothetical protein